MATYARVGGFTIKPNVKQLDQKKPCYSVYSPTRLGVCSRYHNVAGNKSITNRP